MLNPALLPTPLPFTRPPLLAPAEQRTREGYSAFAFDLFLLVLRLRFNALVLRGDPSVRGAMVRDFLESRGGLWINAGRLLGMRADLRARSFINELNLIQERESPLPWGDARHVIEEDLGAPVARYFDAIDDVPLGRTSLSQLHRAHLREEDAWVTVKVQRPGLAQVLEHDRALIVQVIRLLSAQWRRAFRGIDWEVAEWRLKLAVQAETDYRHEATGGAKLRSVLKRHGVYVPKVFGRYARARLLVLEHVAAPRLSDFLAFRRHDPAGAAAWLAENDIDPKVLARKLYDTFLRQNFEDNLVHGSLGPDSILLLRRSSLAVVDLADVHGHDARFKTVYQMFLKAVVGREYAKAADLIFLLCDSLPSTDLAPARMAIIRACRTWEGRTHLRGVDYRERSIGGLGAQLATILHGSRIVTSWEFMKAMRAWESLDAAASALDPELEAPELLTRGFRKASRRTMRAARRGGVTAGVGKLSSVLSESRFFQAGLLRRQTHVFQQTESKLSYFMALVFRYLRWCVVLAAAAFAYNISYQQGQLWTLVIETPWLKDTARSMPHLQRQVAAVVALVLGYLYLWFRRTERRLLEPGPAARG